MTAYYEQKILQALPELDEQDALGVEEMMRLIVGTLDHLDAAGFRRLARRGERAWSELKATDPEVAAWYVKSARP